QVNADLMRAAGFQTALYERVFPQRLDDADMRDSAFAFGILRRSLGTAAAAIASVTNQIRFNGFIAGPAAEQRDVGSVNGMSPELLAEMAFRRGGAGQDDQTCRFLVKAVDG